MFCLKFQQLLTQIKRIENNKHPYYDEYSYDKPGKNRISLQ